MPKPLPGNNLQHPPPSSGKREQEDWGDTTQGSPGWKAIRRRCADDPYFFAKAIWTAHIVGRSKNLINKLCHRPVCEALSDPTILLLLLEWPRRFLKTTLLASSAVHLLVRRVVNGEEPNDRIAFYSSTITYSQRIWREIRWGFEGNELFQHFFPELIPDFSNTKVWNESEGIVPRSRDPKDPTFDCLGGGKATGRHYDIIFCDDLINEENFDSPTGVAKAIEYYKLAFNLLEDATHNRLIVCGNRWSRRDLNHFIHTEQPEAAILSASVWGPKLSGPYRCRNLPKHIQEMVEQIPLDSPLWPERFDRLALERWMKRVGPKVWAAHALNDPSDPEAMEFRLDWLKKCRVLQDDRGAWNIWWGDGTEPTPLSTCNLFMVWDPALEGRNSESYNAILVAAVAPDRRIAIIREYARRKIDPLEVIDVFLDYCKLYEGYLTSCGLEEVLFQKVLGSLLLQRAADRNIFVPYRKLKVPRNLNKDQRIRAWCGTLFESGQVYIRDTLLHFPEHYQLFGVEGAPRDLMDCFAYLTQLFSTPPQPKKPGEEEEERGRRETERGITGYGTCLRRS